MFDYIYAMFHAGGSYSHGSNLNNDRPVAQPGIDGTLGKLKKLKQKEREGILGNKYLKKTKISNRNVFLFFSHQVRNTQ